MGADKHSQHVADKQVNMGLTNIVNMWAFKHSQHVADKQVNIGQTNTVNMVADKHSQHVADKQVNMGQTNIVNMWQTTKSTWGRQTYCGQHGGIVYKQVNIGEDKASQHVCIKIQSSRRQKKSQ